MKSIVMFISGLVIGAGVSWVYHKNKYEEMVQDEVEELRSHMKNQQGTTCKESDKNIQNPDAKIQEESTEEQYDESMEKAKKIINYSKYSTVDVNEDAELSSSPEYRPPFVVTPEDFASLPGFDTDTFYYHQDDVISNDNQEIVDDVELTLGMSILEIKEQFGVYEEDAVYIRNERLKTDYEILRDESDYVKRNGD
jgi:hypothetical protein